MPNNQSPRWLSGSRCDHLLQACARCGVDGEIVVRGHIRRDPAHNGGADIGSDSEHLCICLARLGGAVVLLERLGLLHEAIQRQLLRVGDGVCRSRLPCNCGWWQRGHVCWLRCIHMRDDRLRRAHQPVQPGRGQRQAQRQQDCQAVTRMTAAGGRRSNGASNSSKASATSTALAT